MIIKLKPNKYPQTSTADYIISYKKQAGDLAETIGTAFVNEYGDIDLKFNDGWIREKETKIRKVVRTLTA